MAVFWDVIEATALTMEAVRTSKTPVIFKQTTRHNISGNSHLLLVAVRT
jgi:hypothetical protein